MHTSSLSGTITATIYTYIIPRGILLRKQLPCVWVCVWVCVCPLQVVVWSVPSNQTEIELNWLLLSQWRPVLEAQWQKTTAAHTVFQMYHHSNKLCLEKNAAFAALKGLWSPSLSPQFFSLCIHIFQRLITSEEQYSKLVVIGPLPMKTSLPVTPMTYSSSSFPDFHPCCQIRPSWIRIQKAKEKVSPRERTFPFAHVAAEACVLCDPHGMFSSLLSTSVAAVALPTASLTAVSIATFCSVLIICTKEKHPNVIGWAW